MSNLDLSLTLRLRNELSKGMRAARSDMQGLRDEAGKLGTTKGGDKLAADLKKAGGAASAARGDIAGMRAEAQRIAGSAGAKQLARDLAGVEAAADRSAAALARNRRIGANFRAGRPVLDGIGPARDARGRYTGDGTPASGRAGDGPAVAAGRSMIGGMVGGYTAVEGYRQAAQFDRRMTMIGQTADAARAQIDALGASVHDLAQQTATPVDKLAGGLEALVAQGRNLKEAMDFLPSVARTAAATGSEVDDIAKSADSVASNFSIAGKEMQAAFDIMAAGGKAGQFELKDMARYLPSLSPAAKAAGFAGQQGLADIVAMLQVIRKGSGSAEEAATSMTNVFTKLESDETVKNFKELGVDLEAAMKRGRKEGRNLVEVLEEATQKATKGDLSLLPKLFKDQEFARGMRALMTYRGEWQKLSGTIQDTSAGTVMRDLDRVTKDAQASLDRLSNSWARFMQAASRLGDAGGISQGLGDTAKEFQSIAEALERINKAYAEGGLSGAIGQMTGDAADRLRENRKAWLDEYGKREDGHIAELETAREAHRKKLEGEGRSPAEIADAMRIRDAEIAKARTRKKAIDKARASPELADKVPLRMGVDPAAPIQGEPGPIGQGKGSNYGQAFGEAFPVDLNPRSGLPSKTPLPPRRPGDLPRGIDGVGDVLGPGAAQPPSVPAAASPAAPAPVADPAQVDQATAALAAYRGELAAVQSQLDGLAASGEGASSPASAALEARKAELEGLISDLSAAGRKAGESYATGLAAAGAQAEGAAAATATEVKTALGVDATAEGQKVGTSYTAGLTAGAAGAEAAAAGIAARVRAQLAGAGGSGATAGGAAQVAAIRRSLSTPNVPAAAVGRLREAVVTTGPTQPAGVRVADAGSGARAAGGNSAGGSGGGSGGGTTVHIASVNVNGAGDPDRVADRVGARLASAIGRARSGALHDGTVG